MVTGELPFSGATLLEMANARLAGGDPPTPGALRPALSPRWDSAIRACLSVEPTGRPPSIAGVARALDLA